MPQIRKMGLWGMLRIETWLNIYKSKQVLGSSFTFSFISSCSLVLLEILKAMATILVESLSLVRASRWVSPVWSLLFLTFQQGIVFEHREGSWGDNVNTTQVY